MEVINIITIVGLTSRGTRVAQNPSNGNSAEYRVIAFLYRNNNQATKDSICQYVFGGDQASCNVILGKLKQAHIVAYDVGNEL
jgi:hypothetical protein